MDNQLQGRFPGLHTKGPHVVPIGGPKPKPRDQIRHRVPPVHDWTEVPDVQFKGAPALPSQPVRPKPLKPTAPARPLGGPGLDLWERAWSTATIAPDADFLLVLCEQVDERQGLRVTVLRDGDWRDRAALRRLDEQVADGLVVLANAQNADMRPTRWPVATRRWWKAVSTLPHCSLWNDGDWQFAMDTAHLVAAFHAGSHKLATEIRAREKIMGTTADARRDLRIRYVALTPPTDLATDPSVTAMADYRRSVEA
jgi:hypothetical protein